MGEFYCENCKGMRDFFYIGRQDFELGPDSIIDLYNCSLCQTTKSHISLKIPLRTEKGLDSIIKIKDKQ